MFGRMKHRQIRPDPRDPHQARVILQFDRPITRSRLASWWDARVAVGRQMAQQEYLQWRLACYQSCAPQQQHPLPFEVSIAQGEVVRTPNPEADMHPWRRLLEDPAGEDTFEAAGAIGHVPRGRLTRMDQSSDTHYWARRRTEDEREMCPSGARSNGHRGHPGSRRLYRFVLP